MDSEKPTSTDLDTEDSDNSEYSYKRSKIANALVFYVNGKEVGWFYG